VRRKVLLWMLASAFAPEGGDVKAYYNDNDPKICAWLRELMRAGLITPGDVDQRSIKDVRGCDLKGYDRVHFFAGIGGWDYALQLAGWPDDLPVWTGSCPCQPFSAAGKRKGQADERHLWPDMFRLIGECRPSVILGEQVESAIRLGWLDGVFGDLEGQGYACGANVLGAHSVGAPHIRQRLWWVADADLPRKHERASGGEQPLHHGMHEARGGLAHTEHRRPTEQEQGAESGSEGRGVVRLGDAIDAGSQGHGRPVNEYDAAGCKGSERHSAEAGFWGDCDLVWCRDGKHRRIEPGTFPLADGVPARMGRLRGYGNAIVPQVAGAFIEAYMSARGIN
jgi:DNA (cytosine-5)-methyltransferase 1